MSQHLFSVSLVRFYVKMFRKRSAVDGLLCRNALDSAAYTIKKHGTLNYDIKAFFYDTSGVSRTNG